MFRASNYRDTSGKARVPGQSNRTTLQSGETGMRPSDCHTGVCKYSEAARVVGVRPVPQQPSGDDTTRPPTGKRHVTSANSSSNKEATRRVEGKIGVRKCGKNLTAAESRRTWGTEDDDHILHNNNKNNNNNNTAGAFAHSPRVSAAHTAEQKAERTLIKMSKSDPTITERISKARANGTLITLCQQMERQERVQQTNQHRDPAALSPMRKCNDLGGEGPSAARPPFATSGHDEAPPNTQSKRTFDTKSMAARREEEAERRERLRYGVYRHGSGGRGEANTNGGPRPLPFDTDNGDSNYPNPPTFGKSVPYGDRHNGKARPDAMRTDGSSADVDTLSIQRAANKAVRNQALLGTAQSNNGPHDFIFGNIPPPSPNKTRTLAEQHEIKYAQNNERPTTSGKAHCPRSYQKTSLW